MIQKTKVKKAFNEEGVQITVDALNQIDDEISRLVRTWVRNTKFGNVKRLTPDLLWVALGNWGKSK